MHETMLIFPVLNLWKGDCKSCQLCVLTYFINLLVTTYFNAAANNFILVSNKREVVKKLTLKMAKDL